MSSRIFEFILDFPEKVKGLGEGKRTFLVSCFAPFCADLYFGQDVTEGVPSI